jgi:SOS response regulatory protein OraA/RecX
MESEEDSRKALTSAYRFLANRSYSREELKARLFRKGFEPEAIAHALETLALRGYLNDEEVALQWALSLVNNRGWGRDKIRAYLFRKGIASEIIDTVQKKVWQDHDESAVAREVLKKHFARAAEEPSPGKKIRFLKSRGFSSAVIYRCLNVLIED